MWLGTGFFIVQEGQNAVITQFGRYHSTVMDAGLHWQLPWPIQRQETVNVTQIRSVDVGGDIIIPATGLRTSAMLTSDENIVEVKFAVQYRLSDARAYLFESKLPDDTLHQANESAVREVLGFRGAGRRGATLGFGLPPTRVRRVLSQSACLPTLRRSASLHPSPLHWRTKQCGWFRRA